MKNSDARMNVLEDVAGLCDWESLARGRERRKALFLCDQELLKTIPS